MIDYSKRLVEVDEVLNHLSEENLAKIPQEIKKMISDNKDKNYVWKYDETKPLKDQNLNRDTIAFLSYLNMEYLLNEKQKEFMKKIYKDNEKKHEEAIKEKYNADSLFKKKDTIINSQIKDEKPKEVFMEVYKESFVKKIIKKIKSFFNIL